MTLSAITRVFEIACGKLGKSADISSPVLSGDYEGAKKLALYFKDIFKDDFYIEIQDHGIEEEKRVLPLSNYLSCTHRQEANIRYAGANV